MGRVDCRCPRSSPPKTHVEAVNCHHNYVQRNAPGNNVFVTRKGAVSAEQGKLGSSRELGLGAIGNNARKGQPRELQRTARANHEPYPRQEAVHRGGPDKATKAWAECRKDADVIDEIPMAYKDIDAVMTAQEDDPGGGVHAQNAVVCVKGLNMTVSKKSKLSYQRRVHRGPCN